MEYYSVLMYFFATTWMNAEDIMLHEINQKKKKQHIPIYMRNKYRVKQRLPEEREDRNRTMGTMLLKTG